MINNDTAKSTYTVTEGVTEYPIGFQYTTNPDGTPNLYVWHGDDTELEYGTDYTLSADGLSIELLSTVETGATLNVAVDEPFIQDSDYVVGRIDPEQIERDFDKSVLRDLQLRDYADDINDRLADEVQARTNADAGLQDAIDDEVAARSLADTTLQNNIDAEADAREDADTALQTAINAKQDIIVDLANIRSGAAAGATAVQPSDLSTVATTGSYNDLSNKPRYAASIRLSIDPSTFVVTAQLKDQDNNNIGTAQTIDLPLESVVVSGAYDSATREVVLTLEGGSTIRFSVADLVSGLQTEITSSNKLDADLVDDSTSANKFVTAAEKTAISTAVQRGDNVSDLTNDVGYVTGTDVAADYVAKTGDTMTGALNINRESSSQLHYASALVLKATYNGSGDPITISANPSGFLLIDKSVMLDGNLTPNGAGKRIGTSSFPWSAVCTTTINNGADIAVPTTGGTMARVEDLPSVMTGADGTNAGTSGLVPAPAATDNDKFLSGDGTWKAAGGGATYTAGTGISIDANNEISVTDPVLVNMATQRSSLSIGTLGSGAGTGNKTTATAIGYKAAVGGDGSIAIGYYAQCNATESILLSARASTGSLIQNNESHTFKINIGTGSTITVVGSDGKIPTNTMTKVNTTATLAAANWSSNTQTVSITGMTADGVVLVSPTPANQSAYTSAGILCTAQAAGSLTFTCDTVPSTDITVTVVML